MWSSYWVIWFKSREIEIWSLKKNKLFMFVFNDNGVSDYCVEEVLKMLVLVNFFMK